MDLKNFSVDVLLILILIIISLLSHQEWFNLNTIVTAGDWGNTHTEVARELNISYGTWLGDLNFGFPNIQIYFNITRQVWYLITILGFEIQTAYKVNLLIPIAILGFLTPYFLSKKLIGNKLISFISALFYGTTTYYLSLQAAHLPIAFVYSIVPFIFLTFINALEKNKIVNWIMFSIAYSLGIGYELRIMYIISFLLFFYFIFFHIKDLKKLILPFFATGASVLLLNAYWLLPTALGGISGTIGSIAGRTLFGGSLVDVMRGFTLFHYSWTGGVRADGFNPQPIQFHFWILPFFVLISLLVKNNKNIREMLFYLGILILGIFLVKQSGQPFTGIYAFLRDYFPGFVLFRESSKFYILVAFAYLGLLTYSLNLISKKLKNDRKMFLIYGLLIFLYMLNLKPLVTKEFRTLFVPRQIPTEYQAYKNYLNKSEESFRTLWIPRESRWSLYTISNPKVNMVSLLDAEWKSFLDTNYSSEITTGGEIISLLSQNRFHNLLDNSSIKNIAVPLQDITDLEDRLFEYYGESREFYVNELDKLDYLERVDLGTGDLIVYENKDYKPRVYITREHETIYDKIPYEKIGHEIISSAEYRIKIENVSGPIYINFSESYHPNWKLRIGNFSWLDALKGSNYFISDDNHTKNDANLNSFYIDTNETCEVYDCIRNDDGSYDIIATIFFRPQSYFYAGSVISLSTLAFLLFVLAAVGVGKIATNGNTKK